MPKLDADEVYDGLYQGARPPQGRVLADLKFDALVLAAREHQPEPQRFPGLKTVISVPLDDSGYPPTPGEKRAAAMAAKAVANILRSGRTVLVTCHKGLNRSGLIVGLALADLLPDVSREDIVAAVRRARPGALRNEWFEEMILTAPRKRRPARRQSRSYL